MSPRASGRRRTTRASRIDYDLPNQTAYAETCASVALIFWAQRMLHLDLDGKYADILELALYNGALSGLSRDGIALFLCQSAREQRLGRALGVAHLPVLHDECEPARRIGRRLFHLDRARWRRLPPLWRHLDRRARSPAPSVDAPRDVELSVVGRHQDRRSIPRRRRRSTSSCACRAGAKSYSTRGQWRDDQRAAGQWLRHHQPHLAARATRSRSICRCRRSASMPIRASSWMPGAWR